MAELALGGRLAAPYISELKYLGGASGDFIEIAVDVGTDISSLTVTVYHPGGGVRSTNSLGTIQSTTGGKDIYVINTGVHKNGAVALDDGGTVLQFVSFNRVVDASSGPAAGTSSSQIGTTANQNTSLVSDDGSSYSQQSPPTAGTIPCFASGTQIVTRKGERAIETLQLGEDVLTLDNGFKPIKWIGRRTINLRKRGNHVMRPIEILQAGPNGMTPDQPLYVSPNHRVLLRESQCELLFGRSEVLVPAKMLALSALARVTQTFDVITYVHLLFESHQLIYSNGLLSESLHPGEIAMTALGEAASSDLHLQFPDLADNPASYGPTARTALNGYEAQALIAA
jgi:cold shock CspA family protein